MFIKIDGQNVDFVAMALQYTRKKLPRQELYTPKTAAKVTIKTDVHNCFK